MTGVEDLYVFDGGEVHLGPEASLSTHVDGAQSSTVNMETLHVQDRGRFELCSTANAEVCPLAGLSRMSVVNLTVGFIKVKYI